jgi:hypothetical protein
MSENQITVERAQNGYEVTVPDPKIVKANAKRKDGDRWQDPCREYVFKTKEEVVKFIAANIGTLESDEYGDAFDAAIGGEDD